MKEINKIEQMFIEGIIEYLREEGATENCTKITNFNDVCMELVATCSLNLETQYSVGIYVIDFYLG